MIRKITLFILLAIILLTAGYFLYSRKPNSSNSNFITYQVDLRRQNLKLYWKNENGQLFRTLGNVQNWVTAKGQHLVFAMNGGMFKADHSPQGLFIQDGKIIAPLDTSSASGNFYLRPNGVFYVTTGKQAFICTTEEFSSKKNVLYATQSGPMLVVEGKLHPAFKKGSANLNIRNGVGILPGGKIVFVMSKSPVNFYDFASFFKELGCHNALYLDGLVSRAYVPEKNWLQTDGDFGLIIGVIELVK